ncbi:DUF2062 domain-containing protein [Candidatus Dependentiae bacterium]
MLKRLSAKLIGRIVSIFKKLVLKERSSKKLSLSFCVGLYISFSPFIFCHTIMVVAFAWLFSLNGAAVFAGAFVNNPWTMVPCYSVGYFFGEFVLRTICRLDTLALNPSWMALVNEPITRVTGMQGISFWSFLLGGNLLGVMLGVMLYPALKRLFGRLSVQVYGVAKKSVETKHENSCAEQKSVPRVRHSRASGSGHRPDR